MSAEAHENNWQEREDVESNEKVKNTREALSRVKWSPRELTLPGVTLRPGDLVVITDSRGRSISGVFRGYASSFIALSSGCDDEPSRFLNIRKVNEIVVLRYDYCSSQQK